MATDTGIPSRKTRLTSLISASVLITGLLLMAFVSGAGESTGADGGAPMHAVP
jgi:hypothetical protein